MKKTLSKTQLSSFLETAKNHSDVVPLNQLLDTQAISCVDGRNFTGVVAAPGGNAGLFLQMLGAYELHTGLQLTEDQVSSLFTAYLNRFGHFYMHSDAHALQSLTKTLQEKEVTVPSVEHVISLVSSPPSSLRPTLLELLSTAAHTGCGHVRLMLENAETYRIRSFLVKTFVQEFLLAFWAGDERLQFDILQGDHAEQAIINIHIEEKEDVDNTPLVLVAPQLDDIQVFINHPEATAYMHRQHAEFMHNQGMLEVADQNAFIKVHDALHTAQLTATVQALGAGLPVFDVVLDESLAVQRFELLG